MAATPSTDFLNAHFCPHAKASPQFQKISQGLLHQTYYWNSVTEKKILQNFNQQVFQNTQAIYQNYQKLEKIFQQSEILIPAWNISQKTGEAWITDSQGQLWRCFDFLPSRTFDYTDNVDNFKAAGYALGVFHRRTQAVDALEWFDPLPGFHDTKNYLQEFQTCLSRVQLGTEERTWVSKVEELQTKIIPWVESFQFHQLVHGDPKISNFLFHIDQPRVTAIIDLDTVRFSALEIDIGDALRPMANPAGEDPADPSLIDFSESLAQSFIAGYQQGNTNFAVSLERAMTCTAVLAFELGIRFFSDHLNGNKYFRVSDSNQNFRRACNQLTISEKIKNRLSH